MARQCTTTLLAVALCVCLAPATQAAERIIYVDQLATGANDGSSWSKAYVCLQDALAEASEGEPAEIRVAEGTYYPNDGATASSEESLTFLLPSGVVLRGGYARIARAGDTVRDVSLYPTILHTAMGERGGSLGRSNCIVTVVGTAPGTQLDGVTITGGQLGVEITDANLVMTDCLVEASETSGVFSHNARITLAGCCFRDNTGAGLNMQSSDAVLTDCRFERNGGSRPTGSALYGNDSTIVATHCQFTANEGDCIRGSGTLDLTRCVFNGNATGRYGGVIGFSGTASMRYCRFESNTSSLAPAGVRLDGEPTVSDCDFTENSVHLDLLTVSGIRPTVTRCSFVGNVCTGVVGDSVFFRDAAVARVSDCLFAGNTGGSSEAGSIGGYGALLEVSNCTFSGNRGPASAISGGWGRVSLTQCILWDIPGVLGDYLTDVNSLEATYNDIQGGYPGQGNIDMDPLFVQGGYWADPDNPGVELGSDDPRAVWVAGDYHLQSQAGHWDRGSEAWVLDEATSLCIDAGDPNGYLGAEPFPNGGYVNLGAYGGTLEASRSYFGKPVCENQLAGDINGDGVVNQADMDILLSHWLMNASDVSGVFPEVTITSPSDGDVIDSPSSIEVRVTATDLDGYVAYVKCELTEQSRSFTSWLTARYDDASGDWVGTFGGRGALNAGAYTLTATAVDNDGNDTTSIPITITLQ